MAVKTIAFILSVFPGILLIGSIVSYFCCRIAESDLPKGSADIGLGIIKLAVLVNIPTMIAWIFVLYQRLKTKGN